MWMDLCGSNRDPGNPPPVGGLDMDRKWISPEMKLSRDHLLRWKNTVVENVERSLECGRDERIVSPELNACLHYLLFVPSPPSRFC